MDYRDLNDNELVYMIKENNDEAMGFIYNKYKPLVKSLAKKYLFQAKEMGLELEDLIQEGLLGLCKAAYSFNQGSDNIFYTYALVSVKRTMLRVIKHHGTQKKMLLNKAISYNEQLFDNLTLIETISDDKLLSPIESICVHELNLQLINFINSLSFIYAQVFELKFNGFKHVEIARLLDITEKTVDNACVAIRKRLKAKHFICLS